MFPDHLAAWRGTPLAWDSGFASIALVVAYPAWAYFTYRRLKASTAPASRSTKLRLYASVALLQWLLVAGVLWVARRHGLSLVDLGQGPGIPWRTTAATVLLVGGAPFGVAHAYQGRTGVATAGVLGVIFGAVLAVTRSLVPGQVLHAAIDLINGILGAKVVSQLPPRPAASASPASPPSGGTAV